MERVGSVYCMAFVLTVEARKAEHADLVCDVVPGPWCPQSVELLLQLRPHQQDPVSHGLHIVFPRVQIRNRIRKRASCGALRALYEGVCCADHSVNSSGVFRVTATMRAP